MLEKAREALLARIPSLPPPALLSLLEASFPFVGIPDLRGVPLAVKMLKLKGTRRSKVAAANIAGARPAIAAGSQLPLHRHPGAARRAPGAETPAFLLCSLGDNRAAQVFSKPPLRLHRSSCAACPPVVHGVSALQI